MRYRSFGTTGLTVSAVGFGAWAIGGNWGPTDDQESVRALRRAYELGVTFFDTADMYGKGKSEKLLGEALRAVRERVIIASKVGNDIYSPEPRKNFAPSYIEFALEQSLKRLQTDYLDLYQLHNPTAEEMRDEVFEVLERLKGKGKIRFFGVSLDSRFSGQEHLRDRPIASVQGVYNLLDQRAASLLFPEAHRRGWGVIARVPLASGFLTGKYGSDSTFPEGDRRRDWSREQIGEMVRQVGAVRFLAKGGRTLAQAALLFVLAAPDVSVVIPGAKTVTQVEENVRAVEAPPLSPEELHEVARLAASGFR